MAPSPSGRPLGEGWGEGGFIVKLTKEQWSKLIGAALVFIIALLAVFGYDVALDRAPDLAPSAAVTLRI